MQLALKKKKQIIFNDEKDFKLKNLSFENDNNFKNEEATKNQFIKTEKKKLDTKKNLLNFKQLPNWLKDNEWIISGHRPPFGSYNECFISIFKKHSETGNIWTHMISCLLFLITTIYFYIFSQYAHELNFKDKLVFFFFFLSSILCYGFSFIYHTVSCHSKKVLKFFSKLDYLGINLQMSSSFVTGIYFFFYCEKKLQILYLIMVFVFFSSCSAACLWDKFSEPNYRVFRTSIFLLFGISGILPVTHWLLIQSFFNTKLAFFYFLSSGFFYITGALLYAGRFPERAYPGQCDYIFQSHQIFHILVTIAAFLHFLGLIELINFIKINQFCLK